MFISYLAISVTSASVALILTLFIKILLQRRLHPSMSVLTDSVILSMMSFVFMTAIITYAIHLVISGKGGEDPYYALSYALYLIFWLTGFSRFLSKTVRLTPEQVKQFQTAKTFVNIQISIAVFVSIVTSEIFPDFSQFFLSRMSLSDFSSMSFVGLSQILIFSFVYFYRTLGEEINKNASKLTKARLQLLRYSIFPQIMISISIFIAAFMILMDSGDVIPDMLVLGPTFIFVSSMAVISSFILSMTVNIPNRIRVRYNLAPNRFKYISKV